MPKRNDETQGSRLLDSVKAQVVDVGQRVKSRACKVRELVGKHGDGVTTVGVSLLGYYGVRMLFRYLPRRSRSPSRSWAASSWAGG